MSGERLLLVAQSPVLRIGIRGIFAGAIPIDQIAEASTALEASSLVATIDPTLVVIQDILAGVTGFATSKMLRELQPGACILLLSDRQRQEEVALAAQVGADALLSAAILPHNFVAAVRKVLRTQRGQVDQVLSSDVAHPSRLPSPTFNDLSAQEIALVDGFVRGLSMEDVAQALAMAEHNVAAATVSLIDKLDAFDLTSAIVAAVRIGLVDLSGHLPIHESIADTGISPAA